MSASEATPLDDRVEKASIEPSIHLLNKAPAIRLQGREPHRRTHSMAALGPSGSPGRIGPGWVVPSQQSRQGRSRVWRGKGSSGKDTRDAVPGVLPGRRIGACGRTAMGSRLRQGEHSAVTPGSAMATARSGPLWTP
jgi:hypothetical protein